VDKTIDTPCNKEYTKVVNSERLEMKTFIYAALVGLMTASIEYALLCQTGYKAVTDYNNQVVQQESTLKVYDHLTGRQMTAQEVQPAQ